MRKIQEVLRLHAAGHSQQAYGVLDMAGNVWEWCVNEYAKPANVQLAGQQARVVRGGSWFLNPVNARSAYRSSDAPGYRSDFLGFRVVCSVPIETLAAATLTTGPLAS